MKRRTAFRALIGPLVAVVTLGVVEIVGRTLVTPALVRFSKDRALKVQLAKPKDLGIMGLYVPHPYYLYGPRPDYRSEDGLLRHNSLGCRADEVPPDKPVGAYRIVALGGSTTYSTAVRDNRDVYTHLLEGLLNESSRETRSGTTFQVLNCGVPGYTSAENLSRYIYSLSEYRPDLLLIQQGMNDTHPRELPRVSRDYREFSKSWEEPHLDESSWFLVRLARAAKSRFTQSIWTHGVNFVVRRPFWDKELSGASHENYARNPPRVFEANTRYLTRLAQQDGARVILMSEHIVTDKSIPWRSMSGYDRTKATLEHNEILEKVAREEGALFFDLQAQLCACQTIMPDGRHLNEQGEEQKARALFELLRGLQPSVLPGLPGAAAGSTARAVR